MQEQYRKANDTIHAPEDLIRRTEAAVRQEEKRRKVYAFRRYAAAACLCLVCFGVWNFSMRDRIIVQDVEISANEFSAGLNLGGHGAGGETEIQKIPADGGGTESPDIREDSTETIDVSVEKYDSADEVPEEMWKLKPSRINRREVYIGRSEDTWYAAFEKDGVYWFAETDGATQEELTEYLKGIL